MKGSETTLIEFMEGSKKRFIIPVYQRNYDWKTENCKQLFDDLIKVIRNERKSHFFGSIVSVHEPSGKNIEYLIIDGQQRLTTVSLVLLAVYNLLSEKILIPNDEYLERRIYEDFLVDKFQPKETRIKLKHVKNDQEAFSKLFDSESEYIRESNLTANYRYFYDRIQKQEITVDEIYDAVCRLEIISIELNHEDNPQLIFESLNSTGLDLSEGDKIRNYILMGLSTDLQNNYYEKYWNRIEKCTSYDVSTFVRDYLSIKLQSIPAQNKVYYSFKEYVEISSIDTEELLMDMLEYAKRYEILISGRKDNNVLNACIFRLNRLETTVTRPFFLEVLRIWDKEKYIDLDTVSDIFMIAENYIFRRNICDLPTNALNKIFLTLHRDILRCDGTCSEYVDKLKYVLISKKEKARFPDDEEFAKAFSEKPVYQMNSKNKIYIFERLENYGTLEDKDIYHHCDEGVYTIEHIMPQHLTPSWMESLGKDYEQIHEIWLHRIANLTLTAYNSRYSNASFEDKKTMENGFKDSGIRLNSYIAENDKWTLAEIENRDEHLTQRALTIWKYPDTEYKPAEKQLDSVTLDDDFSSMSGRLISKFSFKNSEQPVTSWVEMYLKVLQILYAQDKSIINKLVVSSDDTMAGHFSDSGNSFVKSSEIGDGVYVLTNTNTQSKLSILERLFKMYGIDNTDLVFYLRDENENAEKENGTRFELRRKYWGFALERIKAAHGANASFCNVNPSKENWINGHVGISGVALCCVASYDSARVELYFGKSKKEENKKLFDKLFNHKVEIESKLGVVLSWNRGDDIKSSKVYYQLDNVGIKNETDWIQMANFHAEWSKRFRDILVPYLE